jgi:hypothetical protein
MKWEPKELSDPEIIFPCNTSALLPPMSEIPEEFKRHSNKYVRFVSDWFFKGADATRMRPRTGVDRRRAVRHLKAIMGSWEPKHEHKEAGVAYLLSLWFELDEAKP